MVVKLQQPENAPEPIEVTFSGIVTEVKLLQPENAYSPIEVTLLGISIEVKLQPQKVYGGIFVKLIPSSNVTEVKLVHPVKAPIEEFHSSCSMVVTLLGIETEVKLLQTKNAVLPIVVTL